MPAAGAAEPDRLAVRIHRKTFPPVADAPAKTVIEDLQFEVERHRFAALFGPSGCGKSTTLNLIAGLDQDFEGDVRRPAPDRTGFVFQEPRLLPWRTVEDNLRLVLDTPDEALIETWLGEMGLADVRKVFPTRLSLGMARRVALARAFIVHPSLLLMDEPFVSLDEPTAERLRALLLDTLAAHPATVVFVTHNLREAIMLSDRIVLLSSTPSRVTHDLPIHLSPEQRRDPAAIEVTRQGVLAAIAETLPSAT